MTRFEGEATTDATPEAVWRVLTDVSRLPDWISGVKDVETGNGWPATGATITFRIGPSRFSGRVAESKAPHLLVLDLDTPSARSHVTSRIEPVGTGARYHRTVDAKWKGMMGPVFGKLFLGGAVKREARKVAAMASRERSTP